MAIIKAKDAAILLGVRTDMLGHLVKSGKIERVDRGFYNMESVEALAKDMEERRKIERVKWKSTNPA